MNALLLILTLALTGCGGVFLPPPPPGPVCIQNIQGEWLNCDCYRQTGAFTWKGWKFRKCPPPSPICRWLHPGPSYDCWYYCGANWHPTADDLRRFGGTPPPTTKDASGRVLHWRAAP